MKTKLEIALHFATAAVILAEAFGLNSEIAALLLASISVGLAVCVGSRNES